jgi:hypothetical protein
LVLCFEELNEAGFGARLLLLHKMKTYLRCGRSFDIVIFKRSFEALQSWEEAMQVLLLKTASYAAAAALMWRKIFVCVPFF